MNLTRNSKRCLRIIFRMVLVVAVLCLGSFIEVLAQGSESFEYMPANSSSYASRSWTGDDAVTWTAEGARTDQTMTSRAICWGNSATRNLISPTYAGGMGTLEFDYVRAFTGTSARSLEVYVNSSLISTITVSPTSDVVETYSNPINVTGNVILEIRSTGAAQVKIDNLTWTAYSTPCAVSIISFSPTSGPPGTVVTISGSDFTGTTAVEFNGESASFTEVDDNTVTATVPAAATDGVISVTTTCIESSSGSFTVIPNGVCAGSADELFFSEYIEGSSNNKAIELYNGTGASISLTNYTVELYVNGAVTPTSSVTLSGTLADGDVYVIANSSANATILAVADLTDPVCNFNGNDAIVLNNGTSDIDVIGTVGSSATFAQDVTLVRKSTVTEPNSTYTASEWDSFAQDYTDNLGSHTFSGGGGSLTIDTNPTAQTECEGDVATFSVTHTGGTGFQWKENDGTGWVDLSDDATYSGTNANSLQITTTLAMNGYQYYCEVDDGSCTLSSNAALLTVNSCCLAPADLPTALSFTNVTANSMDVDWTASASGCDGYVVKIGTDATFTDLVDGTSLPSGSSAPWNDEDIVLTASTSTGFTIGSLDANTEYYFKVYTYNLCGSTYKFNNTGLSDFLTTSNQTYPLPVCAEGTVTLSLENFNEINAEYQWQVFDGSSWSNVANGGSYSGATSRELIIDPVLQSMNGYIYVCQVSNSVHGCTTPSVSFTLTVNPLPATPIIESVTQNCGSTDLTMATPPSGVTWYWQTTPNATNTGNSALTLNVIADGTYYLRAESADGCWSTNSASEIVIVKEVPVVNDFILTLGCGSGSAYIESSITGLQTFELLDNAGAPLVPPRSATFDGNSFTFNGIVSGDYTAKVTYNGCTSVPIAPETLVNNIIAGQPTVSDETICGAGTATLSAVLGTNATVVEWSLDGVAIDDTGLTYDVILLDGQTIPVYVRSNNAGSCPSGWEIVNAISTPSVAAPAFNVGLPVVHCQGAGTDTFTATSAETIVYSITINSGTGTNPTINSAIGEVTYPADFYGELTITATVTGCNVAAATHDVEVVKTLTPTITY